MIKNRFIGRFKIARSMINDRPYDVLRCMQNMIILDARFCSVSDKFEYTAINPRLFSGVALGEMCPEYDIIYDSNKDEIIVKQT